jgi:DNA-binding MarR family transcriptional regulator
MIRYTMRAFTRILQDVAAQHSITAAEFRILRTLSDRATITQVELAHLAAMDRPYAASIVKQLTSRGFVKSIPNKVDRRRMDLRLTERGLKLIASISVQLKAANQVAVAGVKTSDLRIFSNVIRRMRQNLEGDSTTG